MLQAKVTQTLLHAVCHHRPCILQLDLALSPSVFFSLYKIQQMESEKTGWNEAKPDVEHAHVEIHT